MTAVSLAAGPVPLAERLKVVRVLWRQSDTLALWGLPYVLRPNQSPRDLWKARDEWRPARYEPHGKNPANLDSWIWLGSPGWRGHLTKPEQEQIAAFLAPLKAGGPHPRFPRGMGGAAAMKGETDVRAIG